jgi:hypothetical protein
MVPGLNSVVNASVEGGQPQGNLADVLPIFEGPSAVREAMRQRSAAMNNLSSPFALEMVGKDSEADGGVPGTFAEAPQPGAV